MKTLMPIRILVVDDHRIVHKALSEMIRFIDDFELVGQGNNGQEAIELCRVHRPDVVLMDVVMPHMDGIEATRKILEEMPNTCVLALSSFQNDDSVRTMLTVGASGYVMKNTSIDELESIIRTVYEGHTVISPGLIDNLLREPEKSTQEFNLSPREHEILRLVADGMNYRQIADHLTISLSTVKFHVGNMLQKLNVETRNEAIAIAAKNNLI